MSTLEPIVSALFQISVKEFYIVLKTIYPLIIRKIDNINFRTDSDPIRREIYHKMARLFQLYSETKRYSKANRISNNGYMCGRCGRTPGCCCACPSEIQYEHDKTIMYITTTKGDISGRAKKNIRKAIKKLPIYSKLDSKLYKSYLWGNFQELPLRIVEYQNKGLENSLHGTAPYMSIILTWEGLTTLFHLQETIFYNWGVPRDIFTTKIIYYVFR